VGAGSADEEEIVEPEFMKAGDGSEYPDGDDRGGEVEVAPASDLERASDAVTTTLASGGLSLLPRILYDRRLTGGLRSRLNLERLRLVREIGRIKVPVTRTIEDIQWYPLHGFAIERGNLQLWHAGHASAVLSDGTNAIVAGQTGGVWSVGLGLGAIPDYNSHPARSLSHGWDNPDVTSLAYLPGATDRFFAGCALGGALFFVELQPAPGARELKQATSLPLPPFGGDVLQILVLAGSRRIVLACANGVWWSALPISPSDAAGYTWRQGTGLPAGAYNGLAEGPNQTVIAAASGPNAASGLYGIFVGRWQGGNLAFTRATINGTDATKMYRTSVATCDANRSAAYAVAAGADDAIYAVLASEDGGATWSTATNPGLQLAGYQGWYNNCIAVSPTRSRFVVIGWRAGGPLFSSNGGQSWSRPRNDTDDANLHSDIHALYFVRGQQGQDQLFVGSDGGVANTRDDGATWDSEYGKHLQTLQVYQNALDVSSRFPGVVAGGTQDNGNIYCNSTDEHRWWHTLEGGDGGPNRFIDPLGALLRYNNTLVVGNVEVGNRVRIDFWNATTERFSGGIGTVVPVDGDTGGLQTPFLEVVRAPSWRRERRLMYAVAGSMNAGRVYGFFADADGSNAAFNLLADVGDPIAGLASRDGTRVLVGTQTGRIISLDTATKVATDQTIDPPYAGSGSFVRLADLEAGRAFALHGSTRLLRFDGTQWRETAGSGFVAFAADPRPGSRRLFAATDDTVMLSTDDGATWADASKGLPARPHCTDLRLAADDQGGHDLYLATYGRSVWKAKADYVERGPDFQDVPPLVADILAGVLQDGGGIIRVGGRIIKLGPRGPVLDVLTALAVDDIASSMSAEAGREIRIAAMRAIVQVAENQVRQLEGGR
jgi:hypothetical protein